MTLVARMVFSSQPEIRLIVCRSIGCICLISGHGRPPQTRSHVQRLRQPQGQSQEELADRADLQRTYASGVERGVRNPTVTALKKLAQGLQASLPDLVSFE